MIDYTVYALVGAVIFLAAYLPRERAKRRRLALLRSALRRSS